jgi:hypothetical protein
MCSTSGSAAAIFAARAHTAWSTFPQFGHLRTLEFDDFWHLEIVVGIGLVRKAFWKRLRQDFQ